MDIIKSRIYKATANTRCDYQGHIIPKGKYVRVVIDGDCQGKFCSPQHWKLASEHKKSLKKDLEV